MACFMTAERDGEINSVFRIDQKMKEGEEEQLSFCGPMVRIPPFQDSMT